MEALIERMLFDLLLIGLQVAAVRLYEWVRSRFSGASAPSIGLALA